MVGARAKGRRGIARRKLWAFKEVGDSGKGRSSLVVVFYGLGREPVLSLHDRLYTNVEKLQV